MIIGGLSIFWCLMWFLSSVFYSFCCRGLFTSLVKFIPRCFIFWGYCEWGCFLITFSACSLLEYGKATDYYMLILCHVALPKVFINVEHFLMESLGPFEYEIISSANRYNLMFSFSIWIPFISSLLFYFSV
jgi:hypothetical protein